MNCSLNQENETEVDLNIWRNLDYGKSIRLDWQEIQIRNTGSSEHWNKCGDSKGKSRDSAMRIDKSNNDE